MVQGSNRGGLMARMEVTDLKFALRMAGILALAALLTGSVLALAPGEAQARNGYCVPGPAADLAGCNFSDTDLSFVNLSGSNLRGANLSQTNLDGTNLSGVNLADANLEGAGIVEDCQDVGVVCPSTSSEPFGLDVQYQTSPNFTGADLKGADLSGVTFGEIVITGPPFCVPHQACIPTYTLYPAAILTNVKSGDLVGTPFTLPAGWQIVDGFLTPIIAPPVITTTSLPSGSPNTNYSATLAATGGNPPYKWSVMGSLPPGLRIHKGSGTITGKPQSSGTYSFTLIVTGSKTAAQPHTQRIATQSLSITIQ
jgi:hypothetical protein